MSKRLVLNKLTEYTGEYPLKSRILALTMHHIHHTAVRETLEVLEMLALFRLKDFTLYVLGSGGGPHILESYDIESLMENRREGLLSIYARDGFWPLHIKSYGESWYLIYRGNREGIWAFKTK